MERATNAEGESEQRQEKNEISKEVIGSSQTMAFEESCKNEGKRTGGQNPIQRWDCSQIENEEEEESWQEGGQMAEQWEEEQHLEDIVERRRMEGSSLKFDVIQKVPELVVNEPMSQGERVKNPTVKKKVPGWSVEEMKEKPNIAEEEDTEENEKFERFDPGRHGLMLEEVG